MKQLTQAQVNQTIINKLKPEDIQAATDMVMAMAEQHRFIANMISRIGCSSCPAKIEGCPILPYGDKHAKLMVISDAPDEVDVWAKAPLFNDAGRLFTLILSKAGLTRDDIYTTTIAKCYSQDNFNLDKLYHCAGNFLEREIRLIKPKVILTLGNTAATILRAFLLEEKQTVDVSQLRPNFYKSNIVGYEDILLYHTFSPTELINQAGSIYNQYKSMLWQDICTVISQIKT